MTTTSTSTDHHRYDVYLGTIELVNSGATTPYLTESAFESEIRFDQKAVDQISAALPQDSGFAAGIANTTAPDGGSWITGEKQPGWWEKPNGSEEDQPLFDAQARFAAEPQALVADGESVSCTDSEISEIVLEDDEGEPPSEDLPIAVEVELTIGPGTIWVGKDRSEMRAVPNGDSNIDTNFSFLALTVHLLKRTCVVSKALSILPPPPPDRCKAGTDRDGDGISDTCDEDPSIPDTCALRVARSRVFVYASRPKVRLVVKYKTRTPARITTTYTAKLANGETLSLGSLKQRFKASGTFRLPVSLKEDAATAIRSAKSFSVSFSIPGAPKACARAYAKQLTKKQKVGKQTIWFQSDSVLAGIF